MVQCRLYPVGGSVGKNTGDLLFSFRCQGIDANQVAGDGVCGHIHQALGVVFLERCVLLFSDVAYGGIEIVPQRLGEPVQVRVGCQIVFALVYFQLFSRNPSHDAADGGDHLQLRGPLVDVGDPDIPIKSFHIELAGETDAAMDLNGVVTHLVGHFAGKSLDNGGKQRSQPVVAFVVRF